MTISSAASVNLWREAILDRLAVLCMDAPQDEPPASILRRIIAAEVEIALDPSVSDVAPAAAPKPEPVAEIFDTFGNSQDPNKAVGHVWLKAHYFPPIGTKLYTAPSAAPASAHRPLGPAGPADMAHYDAIAASYRAAPAAPVVPLTEAAQDYDWMPEARVSAAQCWCDPETSHTVMDPALAEAVARRIAAWMQTGAFHARNEAYWRDRCKAAEAHHGITGGKP